MERVVAILKKERKKLAMDDREICLYLHFYDVTSIQNTILSVSLEGKNGRKFLFRK